MLLKTHLGWSRLDEISDKDIELLERPCRDRCRGDLPCPAGEQNCPGRGRCPIFEGIDNIVRERRDQCSSRKRRRDRRERTHSKFFNEIGRRHVRCRFGNYAPQNSRQMAALTAAQRWPLDCSFLTLLGPPGQGKTHLAVAAYRKILSSVDTVRYTTELDLLNAWRSACQSDGNANEIVQTFSRTKYLILDDIGQGDPTDKARAFLMGILDSRYRHERPTFCCGNGGLEEIAYTYNDRTASRLAEGKVLRIDGDDYRIRIGRTT
jgi:DNA replication protein DnaC